MEIEWDLLSDSLNERVGLLIGGSRLPDAFIACNFSKSDMNEYGGDGTFIDLTPYITPEVMPNLSAILEKYPAVRSAITQADGKIYGNTQGTIPMCTACDQWFVTILDRCYNEFGKMWE